MMAAHPRACSWGFCVAKLGHDVTIIVGKTKRQGSGKIELAFA
jgi:hypothetical protein